MPSSASRIVWYCSVTFPRFISSRGVEDVSLRSMDSGADVMSDTPRILSLRVMVSLKKSQIGHQCDPPLDIMKDRNAINKTDMHFYCCKGSFRYALFAQKVNRR